MVLKMDNLEGDKPWFASEYIGIDKGIGIVMIENYLSGTIWKFFMKNTYVQEGLNILDFKKSNDRKRILIDSKI